MNKSKIAKKYYDKFSKVYDFLSPDIYYRKPRIKAIEEMDIKENQTILNIPCGTGQSIHYINKRMNNTGQIIGLDLSKGMLNKSKKKAQSENWDNTILLEANATQLNQDWIKKEMGHEILFDSILCDLGLSGFPEWQKVIDNMLGLLKPDGRLVIMDWYMSKLSLRGRFIKLIGGGEVQRPIWQYLETNCSDFHLFNNFKNGEMFVASGKKPSDQNIE